MTVLLALALAAPPEVRPAGLPGLVVAHELDEGTAWLEHAGPRVAVEARWSLPPGAADARLALQLVEQAIRADRSRVERVELLGASWSVSGGVDGLTLRLEAPPTTVDVALAELVGGLQELGGRREVRRAARSWARWRGEVGLSLERTHRRAVNHAWYPVGHPSRHTATEAELAGLRARHVEREVELVLTEGRRRVAVVGPVDTALVERLAATLPGGGEQALEPGDAEPVVGVNHVDRPGFDSALLTVCVGVSDPVDAEAARLLVGALAGHFSSRAVQDLREQRGWIYTTRLQAASDRVCIETEAATEQAADVLLALDGYLDGTLLTAAELGRARATLAVELAGQEASASGRAARLVAAEGHEADARRRTASVDVTSLEALGRELLAPTRRVWVVTGDATVIAPDLQASGRVVRTVRAAELATRR